MQTFLVLGLRKDMSGTAVQKAGRLSKKNGVISKWHKNQHKGSSLAIDGTMWVSKASRALHESTQLILTSTLWVISRLETEKLRHRKRLKVTWPRDPQLPSPSAASTEAALRLWSSETREARDSPGGLLVKNLPANAGGMDQGLPWWSAGKESACQRRGHGSDPWSGKTPRAAEQLSPCTATTVPPCAPSPGSTRKAAAVRSPSSASRKQTPRAATRGSPHTAKKTQRSHKYK